MTTTVFCVAIMRSVRWSIPFVSRLFVGSSSSRMSGSRINAVRKSVRWRRGGSGERERVRERVRER